MLNSIDFIHDSLLKATSCENTYARYSDVAKEAHAGGLSHAGA